MLGLFPPIEPYAVHAIEVDPPHRLHVEQSGNPAGIPVVFLHGGPGMGSSQNHRRYFDPKRYRIVNFDQRGCNRSTPAGEVRANTTADLIADIERIREYLGIDRWLVFGGSWGATLGLLYARQHPDRVLGMVLRGVFLARRTDRDWFFQDGVNRILPDGWERFHDFIDAGRRHDLVSAYYEAVHGADRDQAIAAAGEWARWTAAVIGWTFAAGGFEPEFDTARMLNEVRIETWYANNDYFIADNAILENAGLLPDVPTRIIHGRRDLTCTLDSSWALHRALPGSELRIVHDGGHLASEAVMVDALVEATNDFALRLKQ